VRKIENLLQRDGDSRGRVEVIEPGLRRKGRKIFY